ncbi:cryptic protein-like [Mirounga leonina]|uniref:cryptic protein-like n=1 Tax=Mirounga leonina TaxID=9715 RepID=UPI00156C334C|nr:cryptic protein-like [Mirounga leonina]
MTRRHPVRLLFFVSLALHITHLGDNSKKHFIYTPFLLYIYCLVIISLILSMFSKGHHGEKPKGNREEINHATAQKLQQKTLNWTLNNSGEGSGSMDGWRPQDSSPYLRAFQGGKSPCPPSSFVVISVTGLPV